MIAAPGRFIVFEGIDGAGTTSQTARLLGRLRQLDLPAHSTAEPSTGPVGRLLRSLLAGAAAPVDPAAMALLFAADRRDHLAREIVPHLSAGVHVICDRYLVSSLVYQTAAGVPRDFVAAANAGVRQPDLTLLLSVPAEIAQQRRAGRSGAADLYETEATQRAVAQAYLDEAARLGQAPRAIPMVLIDGSAPVEQVEAAVVEAVESCLGLALGARSGR